MRIRLTYDFWRRILPRYLALRNGAAILECGFGPGSLLALMEGWFPIAEFYGVDIDRDAVRQVSQVIKRAKLIMASAETLPMRGEKFDLVLSLHMVEHLPHPQRFIAESLRVLRPGGIFVIATPNPAGIGAKIMGAKWSGRIEDHISLMLPAEWRDLLTRNGFSILKEGTTGLSGIPIFRKFPLALLNWGPLFFWGFFPWKFGEAYICIAKKPV